MNKEKEILLAKIIDPEKNRVVILPMDHGVSEGPIDGLINMKETILKVKQGGVDAIVIHKGIYKKYKEVIGDLPALIHLSASTKIGNVLKKVLIATVQEIKELGAQGASIHVNLGNKYEEDMLKDLGVVSRECERIGLPLLAMMYPRDEENGRIISYTDSERVKLAARVAFELGADIVKVPYTGSAESFQEVCQGVDIPVVIAGGAKGNEKEMLKSIKDCVMVGAAGVSIGRNAFQADDIPRTIGKIRSVVYDN
ncbi:MAG: fructose-bisphosphate aldolase [Candidatus Pacebacteria bacterium]|nr:fructose-bisphosphate aldolase [Candidatus Paceibacterota bacterium]